MRLARIARRRRRSEGNAPGAARHEEHTARPRRRFTRRCSPEGTRIQRYSHSPSFSSCTAIAGSEGYTEPPAPLLREGTLVGMDSQVWRRSSRSEDALV